MTRKQLERKARQLYSRKKLVSTVEELEEAIKTFMSVEERSQIHTENFIISLADGKLNISVRTSIDQNQLTLNFINPKEKEEGPSIGFKRKVSQNIICLTQDYFQVN